MAVLCLVPGAERIHVLVNALVAHGEEHLLQSAIRVAGVVFILVAW